MALSSSLGVMAILLAKPCISPGASLQAICQLQKAGVPLTDAITRQPAVVPAVGIGVINPFSDSCCLLVGVDIPQGIQHSSVVFRCDDSGVIPDFPELPAMTTQAVECHR